METVIDGPAKYFEAKGFKSYYVVWKLRVKDNYAPFENSLNRTMQYGNSVGGTESSSKFPKFKSYYVVWKLPCNPLSFCFAEKV